MSWVLQPSVCRLTLTKHLNKKFWMDSSDRLMYEGKAPELAAFTKASRVPAFFEHSNNDLPQYA